MRGGRRFLRESKATVLRRFGLLKREWNEALHDETSFWERALADNGRDWLPDEYRKRTDPALELQEELKRLIPAPVGSRVRILDVGAGPLTTLGKRWAGHELEIVPVDPLADAYTALLAKLRIVPPVATRYARGEDLLEVFRENEFDLAYASNSLDHSYDPLRAMRQMLAVVKPERFVYLWHFANEGLHEGYHGLHQWNFDVRDGDFIVSDGRRRHSLKTEFDKQAELVCERTVDFGKPVVIAKLRKLAAK
jgi:SAM-dependent methyltransferase